MAKRRDRTLRLAPIVILAISAAGPITLAASPSTGPGISLPPTACPAGSLLASGTIATIAGTGAAASSGDGGPALAAAIESPSGTIAVGPDGAVYLGDTGGYSVRRIGPDGVISTVASGFEYPLGLAMDGAGDLYLADHLHLLRRIDPAGVVTTVAGTAASGSAGDEGPASAAQVNPTQVAIGPAGDLYIDDTNNYRTIDPAGIIHAFAGSTTPGYSGDGGPAVEATLGEGVDGIAVDAQGVVYLGDPGNHRIRRVDPAGIITTIAGTGEQGSSGDGGPAIAATLDIPASLALDAAGDLFVADAGTHTVRRIDPAGTITTVAGTDAAGFSGDCGPATAAQLSQRAGLAVRDGFLYILDSGNNRIRVVVP